MTSAQTLASLYQKAQNKMRSIDGLQPQEAFDELLKYLFVRRSHPGKLDSGTNGLHALLATCLNESGSSAGELWKDSRFYLSEGALFALHGLFVTTDFSGIRFDVLGAALHRFLNPTLRRALGVYLTPDEVVRAVVTAAAPHPGCLVYDPACGSGTFLIETLRQWRAAYPHTQTLEIQGSDVNARMLLLAELNLNHMEGVVFKRKTLDAFAEPVRDWPQPNSVDTILTNPPFGVYVDPKRAGIHPSWDLGGNSLIPSEVLFVERCLTWLRPGGLLAIVLPRSILTNESLGDVRLAIDGLATLTGMMVLPPETFVSTGTQTNTVVLFLRKRALKAKGTTNVKVSVVDITNVGYDATGRSRTGSQLAQAGQDLHVSMTTGHAVGRVRHVGVPYATPLSSLFTTSTQRTLSKGSRCLGDVVELAQTGRTPARSAYTSDGLFTLKVGNLTGQGIDWSPRERNFVSSTFVTSELLLADQDIVLTSSAHNPKYIAQKIDIVSAIPTFVGGKATFVGEVLRLRVREGVVDPYELLAYLRLPTTRSAIQTLVRGQTAHLYPKDLLKLPLTKYKVPPRLVELLRREAELARELNLVMAEQRELLGLPNTATLEQESPRELP